MTDIFVDPAFRGRGLAKFLMYEMREFLRTKGIARVEWSDCSDRYRQPHNLYTDLGATYQYPDADPIMIWLIHDDEKFNDDERRIVEQKFRMEYTHFRF